jgi:transposase
VAQRHAGTFVIVDEGGSNLTLTPLYARAPKGVRAYGHVPRNTDKNTTLIAALSLAGMGAALILDGATDPAACAVDIEQVLGPTLVPGTSVVLDNLSAHKRERVQHRIQARGCEGWYLPAYSPDVSPIEEAFAKLKNYLRRAQARTREALEQALAQALDTISAQDAAGYFAQCGYGSHRAQ